MVTSPGKTFAAQFQGCQFTTAGAVQKGNLIFSEHTSDPANRVRAEFENCRYDRIPKDVDILLPILDLSGDYTFLKVGPRRSDISKAFQLSQPGTVLIGGDGGHTHSLGSRPPGREGGSVTENLSPRKRTGERRLDFGLQ